MKLRFTSVAVILLAASLSQCQMAMALRKRVSVRHRNHSGDRKKARNLDVPCLHQRSKGD